MSDPHRDIDRDEPDRDHSQDLDDDHRADGCGLGY
jgi:hypothetical protein